MKTSRLRFGLVAALGATLLGTAWGTPYVRQNNTGLLNTSGAWGGGPPTSADSVQWDATCGANTATALGGDVSWGQIIITSPGGAITLANTASASITLAGLGGVGVDMSAATQNLAINNPVNLGGAQTWNVAASRTLTAAYAITNNGNLLTLDGAGNFTLSAVVSGAGGITKSGTGTLTLPGANSFSGQLTIGGGTLYNTTGINNNNANGVFGNSALPIILGATGTTGRLAIQIDGGVSTTKGFTLATGGTGEIQFGNIGTFQITNADRPLTLSGGIGGSGNFVKLGGSAVVLTGTSTYSGTTTVNEGPLRLSHTNAIPGGIGATGGTSALTINGNGAINAGAVVELTAASGNFLRSLGTGIDQFQIPGGISGFDANGTARQVIVNNDPMFELQWGIPTFNPSVLLLGLHNVSATAALTLQNKIDLNGATRTVQNNSVNGTATLSGDIRTSSGTAGLIKAGAGELVLSGTNTYSGPTTVSAGTLTLSSAGAAGGTSQIVLGGTSRLNVNAVNQSLATLVTGGGVPIGTFLRYSQAQTAAGGAGSGPGTILGTVEINFSNVNPDYTLDFGSGATFKNLVAATYTSPITLSGNASIDSSTAAFTLNTGGITASSGGTKTLTLTGSNTGTNTISGVIGDGSGTIAVTKSGTGAWTLTGANTYSGATTVSAGTLALGGVNGSLGNSAVTVAGGTLSVTNANTASNSDRLSDSLALTLNGGTFNFNNDASANDFSESVGTLTLAGGANAVAIQQAAAGRTSTLTFAGLSRTAGAINFSGAGLGTAVDPRSRITFASPPPLSGGMIGPWATVNGTSYASLIGNDVVAYGGAMTDVTRKDSGAKVIPDSATADVRIIEGTGTLGNLTLAASTTTINSLMQSISGGTSAATVTVAAAETLLVNSINEVATAGGLTLGASTGTGTLKPATAGGALLLVNSSTAANLANANNNMTVNSVVADNTSASTVTKDGAGVLRLTATNTYSGGTVINAGTVAVKLNANLGATGAGVIFNGSGALSCGNHPATGALAVDIGTRPIAINNGAVAGLYHNWADTTITIGGAVTSTSGGGLQWGRDPVLDYSGGSGSVVLNLNSTGNTFTGPITVGMGNENAQGGNSQFNFSSLADSANPITFNFNGGTVYFSFNASGPTANLSLTNRPINLLNSNTQFRNLNTAYTLTLGPVSTTTVGAKTLNLGAGGAGGILAGAITDGPGAVIGVTLSGSPWYLSGANMYSGMTTLGGAVTFRGKQALSPYTLLYQSNGGAFTVLDDSSGTINLGNTIQVTDSQTGYGAGVTTSITVGNNSTANGGNNPGSTTTGSTVAFGTVDINPTKRGTTMYHFTTYGSNGYRVQFGNVNLALNCNSGSAAGESFQPQTAPITITGTVRQPNGKASTDSTVADTVQLIGAAAAGVNLISGPIKNAADYDDGSNPNAKPLNVAKSGASTWTLSGVNTYSGATTVSGGRLIISGSTAAGSAVTVSGGALCGTGTVNGAVTLSGTGGMDLRDGAVGTLTVNSNLAINGVAGANNLSFDLGNGASVPDKIAVAGNVTMTTPNAAVITLNPLSGTKLDTGTYDLIAATGTMPAATNFTLATTMANGNAFSLQLDGTSQKLQLVVTAAGAGPAAAFWKGSGADNNWSTVANWVDGGGSPLGSAPGYSTDVSLYSAPAARLTTGALDTDFDINSLTYVAGATNSTTIGGAKTLILEGASGAGITVNTPAAGTPSHSITCKVAIASSQTWTVNSGVALTVSGVVGDFGGGRSLTKTGTGTLTLNGLNTYAGPTIISSGTLVVSHQSIGNVSVPNVLGMSPADPTNLVLNPGTILRLDITGDAAKSTDRGFTINGTSPGDSATLDTSSAGNKGVDFTSATCPGYGVANQTRTLVLSGTHTTSGGNYPGYVCTLEANIADNGSGAVSVIKSGTGYWRLLGNNTFSGGLSIQRGSLLLGTQATAAGAGLVALGSAGNSATLDLGGGSRTILGLATAGTATNQTITSTAVGGVLNYTGATSSTFGGVIAGGANMAVTVNNAGASLTLSGINPYSGATTVTRGLLQGVTGGSCSNSAVTVASAGALGVSVTDAAKPWTCASLTLNDGSQVKFAFGVSPSLTVAPLSVTGNVTFSGTPVVVIEAGFNHSGAFPLLVAGGTAPSVVPVLTGVRGQLAWGGAGNRTLYLLAAPTGTVMMVE